MGHTGPGSTRYSGKLAGKKASNMVLLGFGALRVFFPSIWLLCPSGDHPRGCQGPLDHEYPGNAGCGGVTVADVTGSMALLGVLVASSSSAPVRIEHRDGTASRIVGTLAVPSL